MENSRGSSITIHRQRKARNMREIVELTKTLIRFKTRTPDTDELHHCARYIQAWLDRYDVVYHRQDVAGIPSIWALPHTGRTKILLVTHFDVVNGPDTLFVPVEKDGMLYGRGAVDDKYAVALSLVLFKNTLAALRRQSGGQADMSFGILITGDEERRTRRRPRTSRGNAATHSKRADGDDSGTPLQGRQDPFSGSPGKNGP
ncbi:peptidase, M20/M25/M40 family protein [Desulfococcus multivorans]|nr:peptidase, M20/M25/M40 family protein [Desulfococcus multivorans]